MADETRDARVKQRLLAGAVAGGLIESALFMWMALGPHAATVSTPFIAVGAAVAIYGVVGTSPKLPVLRRLTPEARRFPRAFVASLLVLPGVGAVAAGLVALLRD